MGNNSLEKAETLFWLGRYSERVFTTLEIFYSYYGALPEDGPHSYVEFCKKLGIPNVYSNQEKFVQGYLYDRSNPDSVASSIDRAYDSAITVSEEIGERTLLYLERAHAVMKKCKGDCDRISQYEKVIDQFYAFWGCVDDKVEDEEHRNLMKVGRYVERLDLYMRLSVEWKRIDKEFSKLDRRIKKIKRPYGKKQLDRLEAIFRKQDNWKEDYNEALCCLNDLFLME